MNKASKRPIRLIGLKALPPAIAGAALAIAFMTFIGAGESVRRDNTVAMVKVVSPAVVNIGTEQVVRRGDDPSYTYSADPAFDEFFRDFFDPRFSGGHVRHSLGSGVIIDSDGHVLTNEHVILRASKITITLVDGRELPADLIGADSDSDLAVLQITDNARLPFITMGNSDDLMPGEPAIAIGNPFGLGHTVTKGVISATKRSIMTPNRAYHDFIQTDASINPGNSGGPLINADGQLIGINTAIYQKAQGIGFAIPINRARRIVADLIKYGEVHIGWIGLDVQDLTQLAARKLGYDRQAGGVVVSLIVDGSPARKSSIKYGDIIEEVNGQPVRSREDFRNQMRKIGVGEEINVRIFRGGRRSSFKLKTAEFPMELSDEIGRYLLGIQVGPAPAGIKAVSITMVAQGSAAQRKGLRVGDLILKVNDASVAGIDGYRRAIAKARVKDNVVLLVRRGPSIQYYTLPLRP